MKSNPFLRFREWGTIHLGRDFSRDQATYLMTRAGSSQRHLFGLAPNGVCLAMSGRLADTLWAWPNVWNTFELIVKLLRP